MKVLYWILTGSADATRASVPLHIAVNGSLEIGDETTVLLAGDATNLLIGDAVERAEGLGVPPLRELISKLRDHEVPVFV